MDLMSWTETTVTTTNHTVWENIKAEIHSYIVRKMPEGPQWQTTSATGTFKQPCPFCLSFLHSHKCCQVWSQGSNSLILWWEVTVATVLHLLWEQIVWMLLAPDKEHPDWFLNWFLTDRTADNRKMVKPAQGSLIHRPRQDMKA